MKRAATWSVVMVIVVAGGLMFSRQRREDVFVRDPGNRTYKPAAPVATTAVDEYGFAVLSENVYVNTWADHSIDSRGPNSSDQGAFQTSCDQTGHARPLPLSGWRRWERFPSAELIEGANKVDLYFEVWESDSGVPPSLVVVFRGTDSWKDWFSNLRWVLRFVPFFEDQYHFVSRRVGEEFSRRILSDPDRYRGARVMTTGHSLGGGLAQHFAYALALDPRVPRVSRVFAFDPSPVTGWSSVSAEVREKNAQGLKTDRIFEHGEILAYIRLLLSYVNPPPAVNPAVTEIRYNFVQSINPLSSHSMRQLACDLVEASDVALPR